MKNSVNTKPRRDSNPIKGTIQAVPGVPSHVVIFKVPCSPFLWTRCYVNGRYRMKSTETTSKRVAYEFAKSFFLDQLRNQEPKNSLKPKTFGAVAISLLDMEKATAKKSLYNNDKGKVNSLLLPFFQDKLISEINHQDLAKFLGVLNEKDYAPATKKHHMTLVHKVFKHAVELGVIHAIPLFPKIKERLKTNQPRDYLTAGEYRLFTKTINQMIKKGITYKGSAISLEHKILVNFMVNSFIRPTDLKVLKHKHIEKMTDTKNNTDWLVLKHPATKTTGHPVHTMPNALIAYNELVEYRKLTYKKRLDEIKALPNKTPKEKLLKDKALAEHQNYLKPDDYLFLPEYSNRTTAMEKLGKMFALIVKESGLEERKGKNLTLYSLRHTAIMYRLINSDIDSLALAKNARTSQAVIEKFYGAHLTTDHTRHKLHSFNRGRQGYAKKQPTE